MGPAHAPVRIGRVAVAHDGNGAGPLPEGQPYPLMQIEATDRPQTGLETAHPPASAARVVVGVKSADGVAAAMNRASSYIARSFRPTTSREAR